jgi:hypothetical protein
MVGRAGLPLNGKQLAAIEPATFPNTFGTR